MKIARTRHIAWMLLAGFVLAPVAAVAAEPDGKALFEANCAKCHGPDGRADTGVAKAMKAPSLVDSKAAKGDLPGLTQRIGGIDKHKPVTSKLSSAELAAIAHTVHDMATKKH